MQRTDAFEAQQQAPEFIFPGKHALDGAETLFEDGGIEQRLAAMPECFPGARIGVDVGRHASIEYGLAVLPAIVDAVETDDGRGLGSNGTVNRLKAASSHIFYEVVHPKSRDYVHSTILLVGGSTNFFPKNGFIVR